MTDVSTGWVECIALIYRDQDTVLRGLRLGRERLPFPLLGLDTDNGKEFLNQLLLDYCDREQITFTRSRAYRAMIHRLRTISAMSKRKMAP